MIDLCTDKKASSYKKYNQNKVNKILVNPPYIVLKKEKLSKYIEKKNDNTNHAAELKNAPGRICFVLKFSLGKKTIHNDKNDHKCKKCKEKTDRCKKYMFILEDWFKAI